MAFPSTSFCTRTDTWILIYGSSSIVADPATDEELGTVPEMGLEETKVAITAAAKAFQTWGKTTAKVSSLSLLEKRTHFESVFRCLEIASTRHSHEVLYTGARTPRGLGPHNRTSYFLVECD